jgi:hypothetical protein
MSMGSVRSCTCAQRPPRAPGGSSAGRPLSTPCPHRGRGGRDFGLAPVGSIAALVLAVDAQARSFPRCSCLPQCRSGRNPRLAIIYCGCGVNGCVNEGETSRCNTSIPAKGRCRSDGAWSRGLLIRGFGVDPPGGPPVYQHGRCSPGRPGSTRWPAECSPRPDAQRSCAGSAQPRAAHPGCRAALDGVAAVPVSGLPRWRSSAYRRRALIPQAPRRRSWEPPAA